MFPFSLIQVKLVKKAFDVQREFIVLAAKSKQPSPVSKLIRNVILLTGAGEWNVSLLAIFHFRGSLFQVSYKINKTLKNLGICGYISGLRVLKLLLNLLLLFSDRMNLKSC